MINIINTCTIVRVWHLSFFDDKMCTLQMIFDMKRYNEMCAIFCCFTFLVSFLFFILGFSFSVKCFSFSSNIFSLWNDEQQNKNHVIDYIFDLQQMMMNNLKCARPLTRNDDEWNLSSKIGPYHRSTQTTIWKRSLTEFKWKCFVSLNRKAILNRYQPIFRWPNDWKNFQRVEINSKFKKNSDLRWHNHGFHMVTSMEPFISDTE